MEENKKQYGFRPDAGDYLRTRLSNRFTVVQAQRALGIGETKFLQDRRKGLVKQHTNKVTGRAWFTGMDLYQYWYNQMDDDSAPSSALSAAMERVRMLTERNERENAQMAQRQYERLERKGCLGRRRTTNSTRHEQAI